MGQKFAAFDAQGNITTYYDSTDSPVPDGVTSVIKITDAQWQACISKPGFTVQGGALVAPTPLTPTQMAAQQAAAAWTTYQATAKSALKASDAAILRCYENAVVVPTAWATYRKALRAIVGAPSGDATQPLPAKPAYPPGT